MADRLARLGEDGSPALREALRDSGATLPSRPATRAEIAARLRRRGLPVAEAYLDFFERLDGLEAHGLRVGVSAVRSAAKLARGLEGGAIPVGTAPSDAILWLDVEGTVYDDTDLERVVPVGRGAIGLLEYWLVQIGGRRWSGAVHDCIARVARVDRGALREPLGELAVGDGLSLWTRRAGRISDALDCARPLPDASAVLSARDPTRWIAALLRVHDAFPELVLGLDIPSPPFGPPPGGLRDARWIRCQDRFSEARDGWLVVARAADGRYEQYVEPEPR